MRFPMSDVRYFAELCVLAIYFEVTILTNPHSLYYIGLYRGARSMTFIPFKPMMHSLGLFPYFRKKYKFSAYFPKIYKSPLFPQKFYIYPHISAKFMFFA